MQKQYRYTVVVTVVVCICIFSYCNKPRRYGRRTDVVRSVGVAASRSFFLFVGRLLFWPVYASVVVQLTGILLV